MGRVGCWDAGGDGGVDHTGGGGVGLANRKLTLEQEVLGRSLFGSLYFHTRLISIVSKPIRLWFFIEMKNLVLKI